MPTHKENICLPWTAATLLFLLTLLGTSYGAAHAERHIKAGIYNNPPKLFIDGQGRPAGFWVELLHEIAKSRNWQIDYQPCVWPNCLELIEQGELDLMPDVGRTPDRARRFMFGEVPVLQSWSRLFVPASGDTSLTLLDLNGKRVGGLRNSVNIRGPDGLNELLEKFSIKANIVEYDDYDQAFAALEEGQLDAVITNRNYGDTRAKDFRVMPTAIMLQPISMYFAFPRGKPASDELRLELDTALRQLVQNPDSVYYRLLEHYFETPIAERTVEHLPLWLNRALLSGLGVILVLLLVAGATSFLVRKRTLDLAMSERRYREIFNSPTDGILVIDAESYLIDEVNQGFCKIFRCVPKDVLGRSLSTVEAEGKSDTGGFRATLEDFAAGQEVRNVELRLRRPDGSYIWGEVNAHHTTNLGKDAIIAVVRDITERKHYQERLDHLAWNDPLTALPNRAYLMDYLQRRIKEGRRNDSRFAVIFIDLDNFKAANDREGHDFGDRILDAFSSTTSKHLRSYDTFCRFGGDEFVIVSPIDIPADSAYLCDHLLEKFKDPVVVGGRKLFIDFSIGIALFPEDGLSASDLIKKADMAMYRAKAHGRNRYQFFVPELDRNLRRQHELENGLRLALKQGDLCLHLQPQVCLKTGRVSGCEALLRWQRSDGAFVPPAEFIPIAEQSNLILEVGDFVLEEGCRLRALLTERVDNDFHVDINISSKQLSTAPFFEQLQEQLKQHLLKPGQIGIELTEHSLLKATPETQQNLRMLHDQGTCISLDDFGTGYSALSHLRHFPISCIKIDRSFVPATRQESEQLALMRAIVELGHHLHHQIVVEGVETAEQYKLCRELDCEYMQGYFYQPPLPFDDFVALLESCPVLEA